MLGNNPYQDSERFKFPIKLSLRSFATEITGKTQRPQSFNSLLSFSLYC
jgi:hypothetical protein